MRWKWKAGISREKKETRRKRGWRVECKKKEECKVGWNGKVTK
jgi:hypothetical protein